MPVSNETEEDIEDIFAANEDQSAEELFEEDEELLAVTESGSEDDEELTTLYGGEEEEHLDLPFVGGADDEALVEEDSGPGGLSRGHMNDIGQGRDLDPVKVYLREMGAVELLSREQEIEIAKRIECGEKRVQNAVLATPPSLARLNRLARRLKSGALAISDVLRGIDDASPKAKEEKVSKFFAQMEEANRLTAERDDLWRKVNQPLTSGSAAKGIRKSVQRLSKQIVQLFQDDHFVSRHINIMVTELRNLAKIFESAHTEVLRHQSETSEQAEVSSELLRILEEKHGISFEDFNKALYQVELGEEEARVARNELVRANLRLVVSVSKQIGRAHV